MNRALIVHSPWAMKIVTGEKIWELRKRSCSLRGTVGIIEAGTGMMIGEAVLIDCIDLRSKPDDFLEAMLDKHRVSAERRREYSINYAWVFTGAERYLYPIPYDHPKGAQIWVKL